MAVYCGIDIIEVDRIRKALGKNGEGFKKRVFTENEILYCEEKNASSYQSYAARFAAKEAVSKALGTGIGEGIGWRDIEIINNNYNKPYVELKGKARELYDWMKGRSISISLSHCREYAVAQAVIETEGEMK